MHTIRQIAEFSGVGRNTVNVWINKSKIKGKLKNINGVNTYFYADYEVDAIISYSKFSWQNNAIKFNIINLYLNSFSYGEIAPMLGIKCEYIKSVIEEYNKEQFIIVESKLNRIIK